MKWGFFVFLVILLILAYSISVESKSHKEIEELFGNEEEADVIVVLYDDYNVLGLSNYNYKDDFEMKKMMIKEQQEDVFKDLKLKKKDEISAQSDYDLELTNTYATVNGFAGFAVKNIVTQGNVLIAAIVLISAALSAFAWKKFRRKP